MLSGTQATATVAVRDIDAARKFYESTLGLELVHNESDHALAFRSGGTQLLVYKSQFAGSNRATAVTWNVEGDIELLVSSLRERGVAFEHYDMPEMKRQGDIHRAGPMRAAWFKDPDGNIHALVSER
jgi:catechol 2,3-dioxygenase-like lactoylglutathione lyase family enzyme